MINEAEITFSLLFQAGRKIRALQESFRASLIGDEDRSTDKTIFILINRICNSLLRRLAAISVDPTLADNHQAYQDQIRMISYMVDSLVETYDMVRNSRSMGHMDFIVRPLEALVRSIHHSSRIIVNSVTDYNYSYDELISALVEPLRNVQGISKEGLLQDDVCEKIVKLAVPLAESGNILSYSGLAHELGHFIFVVRRLDSEYKIKISPIQYELIQRLITESADNPQKSLMEPIERTELAEEITDIVHSWVKETVCDCIAVHIMGPAFLFTVHETLSLLGNVFVPKASGRKYYPPPIVRFVNVLKCLEKIVPFNWELIEKSCRETGDGLRLANIKQAVDQLLGHIRELSDLEKLRLDQKHKLALELTQSTIEDLHAKGKFEEWTRNISFPVEQFCEELLNLDGKLERNVPINEARRDLRSRVVPNFRVILNVGWVQHLVKRREFGKYDRDRDAEWYREVGLKNRVLRKSLELAEFDRLFEQGEANGSREN